MRIVPGQLLLCTLLLTASLGAQAANPWADEVVSITYGPGAGFGQTHFPDNVLGPPDSTASEFTPCSSPAQLLALGSGGEIVLRFDIPGIVDGPGPDFTVFENAFTYGTNSSIFAETAFVAVSVDGITWYEFPWNPDPFGGLAGLTPTNGAADPTNPDISGGDSFDLALLGLEVVFFLRLTDTNDLVSDDGSSFDLDAVVSCHEPAEFPNTLPENAVIRAWPNPFNSAVVLRADGEVTEFRICDLLGRTVAILPVDNGQAVWQAQNVSSGAFLVQADGVSPPIRVIKVR